jgi:hypothetical protein
MLDSGFYKLREIKRKDVAPAEITRIILCDVRQRDRIRARPGACGPSRPPS